MTWAVQFSKAISWGESLKRLQIAWSHKSWQQNKTEAASRTPCQHILQLQYCNILHLSLTYCNIHIQYWNILHIKTPCRTWWKSSCSSQTLHLISSQNTEKEKNHYMRIRDTQLDHIWRAKICIFDGHIWHIWARIWAPQIWSSGVSLKRSCKMQFRRVVFWSIGPTTQKIWPNQFVGRFPHCNYNV